MPDLEFGCLPTIIGSMPHTNPQSACALITRYLKEIPAWPQLPRRSFSENMYVQYSGGFPGAVVKDERIFIDRAKGQGKPLEEFYNAFLAEDISKFGIGPDYAAGLHAFLGLKGASAKAVKGQVTGPVSWGLTVADENQRPILYDDVLGDVVPKLLRLKARWLETELHKIARNTIIFLDEPYMTSFGSAFVAVSREKVVALLDEVFGGIKGVKGVHCCGNTDWSVLLSTQTDILSFDAYNYAETLSLYPKEVQKFLGRQGVIAWGIVPNEAALLAKETVASLQDRLGEAMAPFTRNGFSIRQLVRQGLLTPSCGLAALSEAEAEQVLRVLAELSGKIRQKYS